jgi:hypothetical protein
MLIANSLSSGVAHLTSDAIAETGQASKVEGKIASNALDFTPVPVLPHFSPTLPRAESFNALQEWEGEVTEVQGDVFRARLIDVTADEYVPNEVAELAVSDVQDDDLSRLVPGALFRLVVGYAVSAGGTKIRGSRLYFRKIPRRRQSQADDLIFED